MTYCALMVLKMNLEINEALAGVSSLHVCASETYGLQELRSSQPACR